MNLKMMLDKYLGVISEIAELLDFQVTITFIDGNITMIEYNPVEGGEKSETKAC